ncbi:hypothetical protein RRG08_041630 [Elysia crispata]|uniref:Uncharacterized protein n=1 Tax=Elysia crispata TaxID=231223 RepID=A0AAE1CJJ6_9GAST|nr:hypothetical protein RRG08_041630 [Elysia crispata]
MITPADLTRQLRNPGIRVIPVIDRFTGRPREPKVRLTTSPAQNYDPRDTTPEKKPNASSLVLPPMIRALLSNIQSWQYRAASSRPQRCSSRRLENLHSELEELNYAIITDMASRDNNYQKAMFRHCIGTAALKVFNTFSLPDDAQLEDIIKKFEAYILGETNETFERYKFNKRNQGEHESIDQFVTQNACCNMQFL